MAGTTVCIVPSGELPTVVWAAGRVWLLPQGIEGSRFVGASAAVLASRVGKWVPVRLANVAGWQLFAKVGDELIFAITCDRNTLRGCEFRAVRLRPDGTFGPPTELHAAPPLAISSGSPVIRLPDRVVQLTAYITGISSSKLGICCNVDGAPVYESPLVGSSFRTLGLDAQGRLWLAWVPTRQNRKQWIRMVQLDSATLKPIGSPTLVLRHGFSRIVEVACTRICRLVFESFPGEYTWAPGERSPTRIRLRGINPTLIGASPVAGHLDFAYWASTRRIGVNVEVSLARGDTVGARVRVVRTIAQPVSIGRALAYSVPYGTFGPGGFAAIALFQDGPNRIAILPR
jgi:hypothetical protein